MIQIKDDYYINWKKARIRKIFNIFPQNLDRKGGWWMVSRMQNEGGTDNRKDMISFNDFSAPSESRMFIFWLLHQFTIQLYTHVVHTLLTMD